MGTIVAITRDGQRHELQAVTGTSLMETVRQAGLDELLAICGGSCSCSTCHVYIDRTHASLLPPLEPDEDDLLDGSAHRAENSRLSCQILFDEALDGLTLTIAPED